MDVQGTTRLIGLFGDPVAHSLSPALHNAAFARYGLDFAYVPLPVKREDLGKAVDALRIFGFRGANVTIPHKEAVIPFLDRLSEEARLMGAVNTIVNDGGVLTGATTDPSGFLQAFRREGHDFREKRVAVFGTGGAARTIAFTLCLKAPPRELYLVARDAGKSGSLAREVGEKTGFHPEAVPLGNFSALSPRCDILVNATTVGMHPNEEASVVPASCLRPGQVAYDIVYVPERTRFLSGAEAKGLATVGGLGMLVYQGVASFRLWTGIDPDPELFFARARERLGPAPDNRRSG